MNIHTRELLFTGGIILASLVAGIGIERGRNHIMRTASAATAKNTLQPDNTAKTGTAAKRDLMALQSANNALRATNEKLRLRAIQAEQALQQAQAATTATPPETVSENPRVRGGERFTTRMERMRQEHPADYNRMQQRRTEFRQAIAQRMFDREEFFKTLDVSHLPEAQRENHNLLLETMEHAQNLRIQMESATAERRSEMRRELAETNTRLEALLQAERRYLLEDTARATGYQGEDAVAFAVHLENIIDHTTAIPQFSRGQGNRRR